MPQSPGLSAKPGKNWRRSLAAAKRDTLASTKASFTTSRLSMMPSKSKRDTLASTDTSFGTSCLSIVPPSGSLRTRSSFYTVPARTSIAPGSPKVQDKVSKLLEGLLEDEESDAEERTNEVEEAECLASLSLAEVESKSKDEELLAVCSGGKVVKFEEVYTEEVMEGAVKVGEGAFGEVFRVGVKEGASVLKIIPFGGDIDINQEKQTTVADIISEVKTPFKFQSRIKILANQPLFQIHFIGDNFYGSIKTSQKQPQLHFR